jgi:hypothetical protein
VLMAVDGVDVVTKTKLCFCELVAPLLQMLLSVDLVDMIFITKRLRDSVSPQNYCLLKPCFDCC